MISNTKSSINYTRVLYFFESIFNSNENYLFIGALQITNRP